MRAFSAADSVSLAIQRTRELLFMPFRWGTFLKLGLVAILTEGFGSNFQSSNRGTHPSGNGPMINAPFNFTPERIAMAVAAVLLVFFISIVVFYLITRLRFAYFHCLVHNTTEIRPGWAIYKAPASSFFWLNVVVGLCFLLLVVLVALPFVGGFWRLFHDMPPGGHPDVVLLLSLVLPLLPLIFLLVLAGILADVILRDWMLPHFALDNATAGEAWNFVWTRIKAEKKQFFVYALLRVVLPTVAMAIVFMVLLIPGLALAGAFGAIEYGVHSAFADATGGGAVAGTMLQAFFGVVAFVLLLLAGICLGGPISTGIREYALLFYGGRYPALGNILYPPAAVPPLESGASRSA
jgi:hypothetical protein